MVSTLEPLLLLGFNSDRYFSALPLLCLQIAEVLDICGTEALQVLAHNQELA